MVFPAGQFDLVPPAMPIGTPPRETPGLAQYKSRVQEPPRSTHRLLYAMIVRQLPGG